MFERYEPSAFEGEWQRRWQAADLFKTREEPGRPKFYGLDFFPYPSGAGLSVGHCRNYIPTDVLCRMKFMQGFNVLHPMGFDAFGLPAENEAIKRQRHPEKMVHEYGDTYRRQMDLIGIGYDWSRSFYSSDPSYYKWTQWIFKKLHERGLAYLSDAGVNWCPNDKTALANEEVVGGLCERCGTPVEKRHIPQWSFKITDYAQRLLDDLDDLDWPEGIKNQQRNWIGRSEGVQFEMKLALPQMEQLGELEVKNPDLSFEVFTTRIDTIFGVTFCVLAPEHPLLEKILPRVDERRRAEVRACQEAAKAMSEVDRQAESREKTGVFAGAHAINPATGQPVPLYVADYVLMGYGAGAIMAVPGHDQRDFEFAKQFSLPILPVIAPSLDAEAEVVAMHEAGKAFEAKEGVLIRSGEFSGLSVADAQARLGEWVEENQVGQRKVIYKLRDWLISRQRYWGCPIPIIHHPDGSLEAVGDDCLPVTLPDVESYEPSDDGSSPLSRIADYVNVTTSEGTLGRRETDTMGGFACSSWYFLRFCDPHNDESAWDMEKVRYWMPVDCYVGGAEHAVMHLLYARFWTKALHDLGLVHVKEPFARLQNQGQVLGLTPYRRPREGERLEVGQEGILCSYEEAESLPKGDLIWKWARMSKSKGNVVTPDEAVAQYGADALRVYELFVAPFEADLQWSNEGMQGAVKFLSRVFKLISEIKPHFAPDWRSRLGETNGPSRKVRRHTHQSTQKVTEDIEQFAFNTAVSTLMIFVNNLNDVIHSERVEGDLALALSEAAEALILLLAPIAPHSADELWSALGKEGFTYHADWPQADSDLAAADEVTVAVQVNGKLRDTFTASSSADPGALEAAAKALPKIEALLLGLTVRKVIVVPGKLVNIVAN